MIQKHRKLCDENNEKNVGEPKSNCLRSVRDAQPALYDSNVMLKPSHAPPDVRSDDETNEIEDRSREIMAEKLKDPWCIANKILYKYDYSEDNRLALFVPKKRFTPEQISWSIDLERMKAERIVGETRTILR